MKLIATNHVVKDLLAPVRQTRCTWRLVNRNHNLQMKAGNNFQRHLNANLKNQVKRMHPKRLNPVPSCGKSNE